MKDSGLVETYFIIQAHGIVKLRMQGEIKHL